MITVKDLTWWDEIVYVSTSKLCKCDIAKINPASPVNLDSLRLDTECGGIVTPEVNDAHNRYYGFSGYDEYNDYEESEDE